MGAVLRAFGIAALAGLLFMTGPSCGSTRGGGRVAAATTSRQLSGLTCTVTLAPATPRAMAPFALRVALLPTGDPAGPSPRASFTMPAMRMQPVRPPLTPRGGGVFAGRVLLPMSGAWMLEVVAGSGARATRFTFPITCD
jgi:hypothetical protein